MCPQCGKVQFRIVDPRTEKCSACLNGIPAQGRPPCPRSAAEVYRRTMRAGNRLDVDQEAMAAADRAEARRERHMENQAVLLIR